MKANELMLGDLVLYEYNGEKIPARVVEIYRSSALVESVSKEYEPIEIAEDKLFPVAITPEILENNGWECFETFHRYVRYRHPEAPFDILQRKEDGGYTIEVANVKGGAAFLFILYVHKLQHALRLCGISLNIVI